MSEEPISVEHVEDKEADKSEIVEKIKRSDQEMLEMEEEKEEQEELPRSKKTLIRMIVLQVIATIEWLFAFNVSGYSHVSEIMDDGVIGIPFLFAIIYPPIAAIFAWVAYDQTKDKKAMSWTVSMLLTPVISVALFIIIMILVLMFNL